MPKKQTKRKTRSESDSTYFFKLVLYLIVGSQWVRFTLDDGGQIPIPAGLIVGLIFASHDHFKIDRKIEYAVLLIAMLIGFWSEVGIFIKL